MHRRPRLLSMLLAVVTALTVAVPANATTLTPDWHTAAYWRNVTASRDAIEWEMADHINESRVQHGLRPLRVQADLRTVARGWSRTMRTQNLQYHNPAYPVQIRNWRKVGENVWGHGLGGTYVMHVGFMESPGHRANILGDFDEVGVGYEFAPETGRWWATVNFRLRRGGTPAPPPPRPAARPERLDHGVVPITGRLAGPDRLGTAIAVSQATFDRATTAVLARADRFQDALVAGPLAAALDGPLLLTDPGRVDPRTLAELRRLDVADVVVVGGADVEAQLAAAGFTVERLGGNDVYGTAVTVAERVAAVQGLDAPGTFWVANGQTGWPDALAAATAGATDGIPLLLVQGNAVPAVVLDAVARWRAAAPNGSHPYAQIAGGPAVVPDALAKRLETAGAATWRAGGRNRYETAALIAGRLPNPTSWGSGDQTASVWLATGNNWPDALTAAPAAARTGAKLLLVDGADPYRSEATMTSLADYLHATPDVTLLGGTAVISEPAKATLRRALR